MENCEGAQVPSKSLAGKPGCSHGLQPSGCANKKAAGSNKRNMHNAKLQKIQA
jgi:hypothetical protein